MNKEEICIFLIEPNERTTYETFIVYSDDEENARSAASTKINPMKRIQQGASTPQMDSTYLDETLSRCHKVNNIKVINKHNQTVQIIYLGNEYTLLKDFAQALQATVSSPK